MGFLWEYFKHFFITNKCFIVCNTKSNTPVIMINQIIGLVLSNFLNYILQVNKLNLINKIIRITFMQNIIKLNCKKISST